MKMGIRVLLIAPFNNDKIRVGQYLSPPSGIYRIMSYLRKKLADSEINVYDANLDGLSGLFDEVSSKNYDIIGFSLLYPTLENDMKVMSRIKKLSPKSLLIAGGQGASFDMGIIAKDTPIQIVVKGLGEFALEEISKKLIRSKNRRMDLFQRFGKVRGIAVLKRGKAISTKPRLPYTIAQFKEISHSFDFSSVPYERYWNFMERFYSESHLKMMRNEGMIRTIRFTTSSHCPMGCSFCSSTNFLDNAVCSKQKVLSLDADEVASILKKAIDAHPTTQSIYLCDDNLMQDRAKVSRLCDIVKKDSAFKGIIFSCLSRIDNFDRQLMRKMSGAGFRLIIYGVESFSDKILKDMNKMANPFDKKYAIKEAVRNTLSEGITPLMNIILFYPTSRVSDIVETIESSTDLVEEGARITTYSYVEVYPGARMMDDKGLKVVSKEVKCGKRSISLPQYILPEDEEIQELAEQSLLERDRIVSSLLRKYDWNGVVPHPIYSLALFLAVYSMLGIDSSRIESLISRISEESSSSMAVPYPIIRSRSSGRKGVMLT